MARCWNNCRHNVCGICHKYNEIIRRSKVPGHYNMPLHPLDFVSLWYTSDIDVDHLIEIAEKHMTDEISKNICQQFHTKGTISFKQRKYLVYNILHCGE